MFYIRRKEVSDGMKDMPDGAFLIQDATTESSYCTLTIWKGRDSHFLSVLSNKGLYGIKTPLDFNSIVSLVEYYKKHPVPELEITLGMPISWRALIKVE